MKDFYATIIIDLNNKSEEEVLKNVDRSRRKNVNKANSLGVLFKDADDREWEEYYKIYSRVWKDGGVNPEPFEKLKGNSNYKLFVAKKDNIVLGGGLIDISGDGIRFEAFASSIEHQEMRVNDFLYWNSILWALKNGKKHVDLGGYQIKARGHMVGINSFKEKWGGQVVYREVEGNVFYILGRKLIRNVPAIRWIWDRIKGRPIPSKNKKSNE